MSGRSTSTRRGGSTRAGILTAAAIFQLLMAQPEGASVAHAKEWEGIQPEGGGNLQASKVLEKMRRDGTAITNPGQAEFFSAYRVMTSGAA